jgi:hypothetical protein
MRERNLLTTAKAATGWLAPGTTSAAHEGCPIRTITMFGCKGQSYPLPKSTLFDILHTLVRRP